MIDRFIDKILDLRLFRSFKVKTTPRWIILMLDMLIVMASYIATVVADMYSLHSLTSSSTILTNAFIVFAVYFAVTYISKSYTCVISLSVNEDLYRIFMAIVVATLLLFGFNGQRDGGWNVCKMFWNMRKTAAFYLSCGQQEKCGE